MIRPARPDDLPLLREVERAAGRAFAEIGMTAIAQDEPPSLAELGRFQRAGRAWVHTDPAGAPAAYLLAQLVDGCAHIEQVSVHPEHAREGRGRQLIDHLARQARRCGVPALTLTTFTEVPWNGPYYLRCGFRYLADHERGPGLREVCAAEAARGLTRWPRAAMRRDV